MFNCIEHVLVRAIIANAENEIQSISIRLGFRICFGYTSLNNLSSLYLTHYQRRFKIQASTTKHFFHNLAQSKLI